MKANRIEQVAKVLVKFGRSMLKSGAYLLACVNCYRESWKRCVAAVADDRPIKCNVDIKTNSRGCDKPNDKDIKHTRKHTHTHTHLQLCMCVCVCVEKGNFCNDFNIRFYLHFR